jgi:hypothetical protein
MERAAGRPLKAALGTAPGDGEPHDGETVTHGPEPSGTPSSWVDRDTPADAATTIGTQDTAPGEADRRPASSPYMRVTT